MDLSSVECRQAGYDRGQFEDRRREWKKARFEQNSRCYWPGLMITVSQLDRKKCFRAR